MPFRMQAPMNEEYVDASALHMLDPKQIRVEANATGRRPNDVAIGTLEPA